MAIVLDTGALIAIDRRNRDVIAVLEKARQRQLVVRTSSGCVAQAWRKGGPNQANLARALVGISEVALDESASRSIGRLCAATHTSDVIDAHVALLTTSGDLLLTSDVGDLQVLIDELGERVQVSPC
jgi:hypothetical protein